jgi:hypothetical protein
MNGIPKDIGITNTWPLPTRERGRPLPVLILIIHQKQDLVERVAASSPPSEEYRQANSLDELCGDANTNCIERTLLLQDLRNVLKRGEKGIDGQHK